MFRYNKPESPSVLAQRYEDQASIQRALISDLRNLQDTLGNLERAFRTLLADAHFITLLRAEGLESAPSVLVSWLVGNELNPSAGDDAAVGIEELLHSKKISPAARCELARMVRGRQVEAARLMTASGCFEAPYVRALVGACDNSQLLTSKGRPRRLIMKQPERAAANNEISKLAGQLKELSGLGAKDAMLAFLSIRYVQRLLANTRVRAYLAKHWPGVLSPLKELDFPFA